MGKVDVVQPVLDFVRERISDQMVDEDIFLSSIALRQRRRKHRSERSNAEQSPREYIRGKPHFASLYDERTKDSKLKGMSVLREQQLKRVEARGRGERWRASKDNVESRIVGSIFQETSPTRAGTVAHDERAKSIYCRTEEPSA